MIHLVAIKIGPRKWKIVSSDVRDKMWPKYDRPDKFIKKMRESGREWVEDQPHWSVIYDKEPVSE